MGGMFSSSGSVPMEGPLVDFINSEISSNCVVIFSKTTCPYCTNTKKLFKEIGTDYKLIELDKRGDGGDLQDILGNMTGQRTVPRVFINGECIGGNSETRALHRKGELEQKIKGCTG